MSIGENIRKFRKLRKMTLVQLEEKTGISNGSLSNIESGKRNPSISSLNKIANALNIGIDYLISPELMLNRINFMEEIFNENKSDKKISDLYERAKNNLLTDKDIENIDGYIRTYIFKKSSNYNGEPLINDAESDSYSIFQNLFYSLGYNDKNLNEYQLQYFLQNENDEEGTSEFMKYLFKKVKDTIELEIKILKDKDTIK